MAKPKFMLVNPGEIINVDAITHIDFHALEEPSIGWVLRVFTGDIPIVILLDTRDECIAYIEAMIENYEPIETT